MKKIKKVSCLSAIAFLAVAAGGLTACNKAFEPTEYTGELGSVFTVPEQSELYTVKNSKGEAVSVFDGAFTLVDLGGYVIDVGTQQSAIIVNVVDTVAPEIHFDEIIFFAKTGENVNFGSIYASDVEKGMFAPTANLLQGETTTEIDLNDFSMDTEGVYEILLSANDSSGNTTEQKIFAEINNSDKSQYLVAGYSSVYGMEQIATDDGAEASYSTDVKRENENGALKVSVTSESALLSLQNTLSTDVSNSGGISFYIYNNNDTAHTVTLGDNVTYNLFANEWTEIFLSPTQLESIKGETDSALNDINGLTLKLPRGEFYLSDVNYIPAINWFDYFFLWRDLVGLPTAKLETAEDVQQCYDLYRVWNNYSAATQKQIYDYQAWYYRVEENGFGGRHRYPEYFKDTFGMRLLAYYAGQDSDFVQRNDKIVYNDSALGSLQMLSPDNSAKLSYDKSVSCTATGETGSLKIQAGALENATLTLDFPLCSNTFAIDNVGVSSGETYSFYSKMYFYAYCDEPVVCTFGSESKTVNAGEWTRIEFQVDGLKTADDLLASIKRQTLQFLSVSGKTVYMSSIYTQPDRQTLELQELINAFLADTTVTSDNIASNDLLNMIYAQIVTLDTKKRERLSNLDDLLARIESIFENEKDGITALHFNSLFGKYQVYATNATTSYSTDIKYGTEAGSLKIASGDEKGWDISLYSLLLSDIDVPQGKEIESYTFYVYLENTQGYDIDLLTGSNGKTADLIEGEWVEVTFTCDDLANERIYFYVDSQASRIPQDMNLYLSAIKANFS